ncbi:MAG TPA: hypothetical protein VLG71_01030 [Candidatus Limnocylindria bacterium]|nr:hypothetical protein [Candidatus Limnocylindria bacterium]
MLRKIFICTLALTCVGQAKALIPKTAPTVWVNNDPHGRTLNLYFYTWINHEHRWADEWILKLQPGESRQINFWGPKGQVTNDMWVKVFDANPRPGQYQPNQEPYINGNEQNSKFKFGSLARGGNCRLDCSKGETRTIRCDGTRLDIIDCTRSDYSDCP